MSIGIKEYRELNKMTHNPKVDSSSLSPATKTLIVTAIKVVAIFYCFKIGCNNALKWQYYVELGKNWVK